MYVWPPDFVRQTAWRAAGWRRGNMTAYFSRILLNVTVLEETMACQDGQLCAGLKAGIDGAIYGVQAIWDKKMDYGKLGIIARRRKERFQRY